MTNKWHNGVTNPDRGRRGTALIETIITLPLLLLLTMNMVNFGIYLFDWITLSNASRAAALYQVYSGVVVGSNGNPPAYAAVQAVVTGDAASITNSASITVQVCSVFNGTNTCSPGQTYTPQPDPDPTHYRAWSIDVAYTYTPFFPALTLPVINIPLTIPATTIHRQVVMRSMQ